MAFNLNDLDLARNLLRNFEATRAMLARLRTGTEGLALVVEDLRLTYQTLSNESRARLRASFDVILREECIDIRRKLARLGADVSHLKLPEEQ